jgi:thymidine kinase
MMDSDYADSMECIEAICDLCGEPASECECGSMDPNCY